MGGHVIEFKEDGTYNMLTSEFGTFQLEDNFLTITVADEYLFFCPGKTGTYDIELTEEGKLHWALREDECSLRAMAAQNSLWTRISP